MSRLRESYEEPMPIEWESRTHARLDVVEWVDPKGTTTLRQRRATVDDLRAAGYCPSAEIADTCAEPATTTRVQDLRAEVERLKEELAEAREGLDTAFAVLERRRAPESTDGLPDVWMNIYPDGFGMHKSEDDAAKHSGINVTHIAVPYVPQTRVAEAVRQALEAAAERAVTWWALPTAFHATAEGLRRAILGTGKPEVK